ncbi:RNase adapter RapZ [Thermodesulfovibrio thiophilus]|uniref:RNase adapter RapZ n=1 Tax=Thermodesulfovibrio thiophilus TaxID=340095 RepID=UPI0017966B0B|nr:RNase adapter RapZ [Thermodesulfovibrio thiophilus]HHW19886.1 RNase adapter RapZ [Thermodesulfovibrio thiophilus]
MPLEKFIIIVTGLSGGGKTVTIRTLEDIGFFCVDNLPPPVILEFLGMLNEFSSFRNIAIGIDIRAQQFLEKATEVLKKIKDRYKTEVLFMEADDETILLRYKETRRPHPLSGLYNDLLKAIKQERVLLYPIRSCSDRIIDTSNFNPHALKFLIRSLYGAEEISPSVTVMSFGYKKGIPANADLVFDARFLPNPYFVPFLTDLNGTDEEVKNFVLKQNETVEFLKYIKNFLNYALSGYKKEGRPYITIAIGCTGGKHRSVVIAEEIARYLRSLFVNSVVIHRDL